MNGRAAEGLHELLNRLDAENPRRRCASPAVFPDTPAAARFWSSTSYIYNDIAAVLDVAEGQNSTAPKEGTGSTHHVSLVR